MKTLKQLREEHAAKAEELMQFTQSSEFEKESFENKKTEIQSIESQIKAIEEAMAIQAAKMPTENEQKELRRFDLLKALRDLKSGRIEGHAAELTEEGKNELQQLGVSNTADLVLPSSYLKTSFRNDLSKTGTPNNASDFIPTEVSQSVYDVLTNNLVFNDVATFLGNLTGNIKFPRLARSSNPVSEVAEKSNNTDVTPDVAALTLTPKSFPVEVEMTDDLLIQSSPDVEALVRRYLGQLLAEHLESYAISQILANADIGSVEMGTDGAAVSWAKIVELETTVKKSNAARGALAYLTNSSVAGAMKTTPKISGYPVFLQEGGETNGRQVRESEAVPSNLTKGTSSGVCSAMIYANWQDLYIGQWGGIGLMYNPYRRSNERVRLLEATMYADAGPVQPASFAAIKDITTA